jgi:hypothetical protein
MRGYDEDQDVMWFPESETRNWRSRTLEEIAEVIAAARVNYIDARLQYWETNKESIKPVSFHWTDKGEGETL